MSVEINKDMLYPSLLYNKPVKYDDYITLYPVTMNDVIMFNLLSQSITVRKNSTFRDKKIIKMTYLDFLIYASGNEELEEQYKIQGSSMFYVYAIQLLQLCCKDAEIEINQDNGWIVINEEIITPQIFDDLRRIIIIQNDIDFDIDEFINYDTEQTLKKAEQKVNKEKDKASIEDYIDSLIIVMNTTEERIMNMTIRKFWRYVKRYQLFENYKISKTGECSGFVTFKEPIKYWMISLEDGNEDKYKDVKTDEGELRSKIG